MGGHSDGDRRATILRTSLTTWSSGNAYCQQNFSEETLRAVHSATENREIVWSTFSRRLQRHPTSVPLVHR